MLPIFAEAYDAGVLRSHLGVKCAAQGAWNGVLPWLNKDGT